MSRINQKAPDIILAFNKQDYWVSPQEGLEEKTLRLAINWLSEQEKSLPDYRQALLNLTACAANVKDVGEGTVCKIRVLVSAMSFGSEEQTLLEESLSKLHTPLELAFKKLMSLENVACFLGDKVIGGSELEGNSFSSTLPFLIRGIECAVTKHDEDFTEGEKATLEDCLSQLAGAEKIHKATHTGGLETSYLKALEALEPGKSILLPGGWAGRPSGHALLYHVTCLQEGELEWKIINTGGGLEFHAMQKLGGKLYADTVTTYRLKLEELKKKNLLQICGELKRGDQGRVPLPNFAFRASDLYKHFLPYQVLNTEDGELKRWMQAQLAGTCAMRSVLAFIHGQTGPKLYSKLLGLLKEEVFAFSLENLDAWADLGSDELKVLSSTLPSVFRRMKKALHNLNEDTPSSTRRTMEARLKRARAWGKQLEEMQRIAVYNALPSPVERLESKSDALAAILGQVPKQADGVVAAGKKILEVKPRKDLLALTSFKSLKELTATLCALNKRSDFVRNIEVGRQENHDLDQMSRYVVEIAREFLNSSHLQNDGVPGSPCARKLLVGASRRDLEQFLDSLRDCSLSLNKAWSTWILKDELNILAVNASFMMAWVVIHKLDTFDGKEAGPSSLSYYGVAIPGLERLRRGQETEFDLHRRTQAEVLPAMNKEWEEVYEELLNFASWINRHGRPKLFNFVAAADAAQMNSEFDFSQLEGENALLLHTIPVGLDLSECDSQYEKEAEVYLRKTKELPSKESWQLAWRYARTQENMPVSYSTLVTMALTAQVIPNSKWNPGDITKLRVSQMSIRESKSELLNITFSFESALSKDNWSRNERLAPCLTGELAARHSASFLPAAHILKDDPKEFLTTRMSNLQGPFGSRSEELIQEGALFDVYAPWKRSENKICAHRSRDLYNESNTIERRIGRYARIFKMGDRSGQVATVRLALLRDYYASEPLLLLNWRDQMVFSSSLWQTGVLSAALKDNPYFGLELEDFFRSMRQFFVDYLEAQTGPDSRATQAIAFLIENQQRLLQWFKAESRLNAHVENKVAGVQEEIRTLINDPNFVNPALQLHLHLSLIESYAVYPNGTLSRKQARELLLAYHKVRGMLIHEKVAGGYAPAIQRPALRTLGQHEASIRDLLANANLEGLAGDIAHCYRLVIDHGLTWSASYPRLEGSRGLIFPSLMVIDLDTGCVTRDRTPLKPGYPDIKKDPVYLKLFGNKVLGGSCGKGYVEDEDALGTYRIYFRYHKEPQSNYQRVKVSRVDRKIPDGEWYSYVDVNDKKTALPVLPGCPDLSLWQKRKAPSQYKVLDLRTLEQPVDLTAEGCFTFPDGRQREWVSIGESSDYGLSSFDPNASLWQGLDPSEDRELLFPTYVDPRGTALAFEQRPWRASDGSKEPRWVWAAEPHLSIVPLQKLESPKGFSHFLMLESVSGRRELFIPKHPIKKVRGEKDSAGTVTECFRIPMDKGQLRPNSPEQGIYLAYLSLHYAQEPADYIAALDYLEGAFKDKGYSGEALRLLGWIFTSTTEGVDTSGFADSIRLYAAWLVQDNTARNVREWHEPPPELVKTEEIPARVAPLAHWECFWSGQLTWKDRQKKVHSLASEIEGLTKHYVARRSTVPALGRVEQHLDGQAWLDFKVASWGVEDRSIPQGKGFVQGRPIGKWSTGPLVGLFERVPPIVKEATKTRSLKQVLGSLFVQRKGQEAEKRPSPKAFLPMLRVRPSEWRERFSELYALADQGPPTERQELLLHLKALISDPDPGNVTLNLLLIARLSDLEPQLKGYGNIAETITRLAPEVGKENSILKPGEIKKIQGEFTAAMNDYRSFLSRALGAAGVQGSAKVLDLGKTTYPFPERTIPKLPQTAPASQTLKFIPYPDDVQLDALNTLAKKHFQAELTAHHDVPQRFKGEGAGELNKELEQGAQANKAKANLCLKESGDIERVPQIVLEALAPLIASHRATCTKLETQIVKLANRDPEAWKAYMEKSVQVGLKQRHPLTIDDCIALFLQQSKEGYRAATDLDILSDIAELFEITSRYVQLSRRLQHLDSVAVKASEIIDIRRKDADKPCKQELACLGALLAQENLANTSKAPVAMHVFQYYTGIFAKRHQVEGIDEMLPSGEVSNKDYHFPQIFLRRLQGEGKSFLIAPMKALLNADGFHLSIHVPPSPLYESVVAEMRIRGRRLFRQKERTLTFDDNPKRFTPEYLDWMMGTLYHAIIHREFVTVTQETLRAMLAKSNRTRLEIEALKKQQPLDFQAIQRLEERCAKLEDILALINDRGVLTFDEVHTATDPNTELNMPVGVKSRPNSQQAAILAAATAFASTREQTVTKLAEKLVDSLFADPKLAPLLGIGEHTRLSKETVQEIKNYVLGLATKPPAAIVQMKKSSETVPGPAEHLVLIRELLVDGWLQDALKRRVEEEHGIDPTGDNPKVSIPFAGNKNPLVGSEFSEIITTLLFTFAAYRVQGVSNAQMDGMMADWVESAQLEFRRQTAVNPLFKLADTVAAKEFEGLMGRPLFGFDLEKDRPLFKERLAQADSLALHAIYDYVVHHEIPAVEIFETEVCANGQNLCTLGRVTQGFSGTFFKNMEPPGVTCSELAGTDGQTMDVLLKRSPEICVVKGAEDVIEKSLGGSRHCENIRAFIDTGNIFIGQDNTSVAQQFARTLPGLIPGIKAVLYFDQGGNGYWMRTEAPYHAQRLSGITAEVVAEETGLKPNEIFTYYDQIHCTGTNIKQTQWAVAVASWGEQTGFTEDASQGVRRMRGLDTGQMIVSCVTAEALKIMGTRMGKTFDIEVGNFAPTDKLHVRDLIQHSYLKQTGDAGQRNLDYCLQKLRNVFQKAAQQQRYLLPAEERQEFFETCSFLVSEPSALRLWEDYAYPPKSMAKVQFLEEIISRYLAPLKVGDGFSKQQLKEMRSAAEKIVKEALPYLDKHIIVSGAFDQDPSIRKPLRRGGLNQKAQVRSQERSTSKEQAENQQDEKEQVGQKLRASSSQKKREFSEKHDFRPEQILAADFCSGEQERNGENVAIYNYGDLLVREGLPQDLTILFDQNTLCTENFSNTFTDGTDLLGRDSKRAMNFLFVQDGKDSRWKVLLCTVEDAQQIYKTLLADGDKAPQKRTMILARSDLSPMITVRPCLRVRTSYSKTWKLPWQAETSLKNLHLGILLTQKHLRSELSKKKHLEELDVLIDERQLSAEFLQHFYEERVLEDAQDPVYIYGGLKDLLDRKAAHSVQSRKH